MFTSILRNFRNAGHIVSISFNLDKENGSADVVFEHKASALDIHNLASKGHRDLLKQAKASQFGVPKDAIFQDAAWPVAVAFLVKNAGRLRCCGPEDYGIALPYLAFLAEYKGLDWVTGESHSLTAYQSGKVNIYWIGENLQNDYFDFGNYKRI